MKISFIVKTNRNIDYECIDLQKQRTNGVFLITNYRLTKIGEITISKITIYGHDEDNIINEMEGQMSDGIFENNTVEVIDIINEK